MLTGEHLLLNSIGGAEDTIDLTYVIEALDARLDREDVVLLPGLHEERTRRGEPGDVVHLSPIQNPGHVVVDAVREAPDAVSEGVEVSAHQRDSNTWLERRREYGN